MHTWVGSSGCWGMLKPTICQCFTQTTRSAFPPSRFPQALYTALRRSMAAEEPIRKLWMTEKKMKNAFVLAAAPLLLLTSAFQQVPQETVEAAYEADTEVSDDGIDCSVYDGRPVHFDDAQAAVSALSIQKGEYETTAEFQTRVEQAGGSLQDVAVFRTTSEGRPSYNADEEAAVFYIKNFGLQNANLGGAALSGMGVRFSGLNSEKQYSFLLSSTTTPTGSYVGTTALGVRTRITKNIEHETYLIHDGPDPREWIWGIDYPPSIARALLPTLKSAIVVDLSRPASFRGDLTTTTPELDHPYENTLRFSLLIGRFACGLMYTPDGKVVATFDPDDI